MATKSFAIVSDVEINLTDTSQIDVALYFIIFGNPGTTLLNSRQVLWVRGLSPDSATLSQEVSDGLKTYLTTNGVTFGLLDTVHLEW